MQELLSAPLQKLLAGIDTRPEDPVRVILSGPPGHGKSTVLTAIGRHYRAAGVPVIDRAALPGASSATGGAVLVDDADTLTPSAAEALVRLAGETSRLVLTHTPGAAGSIAAPLATTEARHLRLAPWATEDVARFATSVLGRSLTGERATAVQQATAGVPRLVARCFALPAEELVDQLRAELDGLGEAALTYLVAAGIGGEHDVELLATVLDDVAAVVAGIRAAGLLAAGDTVPPLVARAVRDHVTPGRQLAVLVRLLETRLASGQPVLPITRELRRLGATGDLPRAGLEAAAAEAAADDPGLAADLYAAAAREGSPVERLAPGWARAAVLAGRLDTALRLGDELLSAAVPEARAEGALLTGTVLARRGDLARGAELLRWSGDPGARRLADLAGIALGHVLPEADEPPSRPLSAYGHVAGRLLDGIRASVSGRPDTALATLLGAADSAAATGVDHLLPDSPAVLTAVVALHAGEFELARGVLTRAAANKRHTLLLGWTELLAGDLTAAAAHRTAVRHQDVVLAPRDDLLLRALDLGLARRGETPEAVRKHWNPAYEAMMRQPLDLFTLLPLGELLVAAARLGEGFRVAAHHDRALALLERHGSPPLWADWLRWSAFHAAIVGGDRETARRSLGSFDPVAGRLGSALAAAGAQWLAVLDGAVEPDRVLAAADSLHRAGLRWDAARLAGQAAIRATDRAAMISLLRAAKRFTHGMTAPEEPAAVTPAEPPALTTREREIGRLLVDGHIYREIGERLHISGKTVEHHVGRIRAKLGVTDRRTLVTLLSGMLGDDG
ncbi:LuxR C-terminal-related transcriptional regulator [Amycolatopsis sp. Hca4]|uniref:LuxR C-terminal-related transcriptional regulator n=1 Tax=Amycolatopsis sp. Hca4 TaxID=2742131 RepID=UPI001592056F|nr:LuxR C-terminal-related transcriptional regulator [Amycolatopsis sp. Hca4]QKV73886.1 helix-turn-helix transcriptional regulator [Amycolatopsis sp. Hca4]